MATRVTSTSRVIPASAKAIFDLLCDPTSHIAIDGSGSVRRARGGVDRLRSDATFTMEMRKGIPYVTRNRVVEFEEDRRIAWHHFSHLVWRYELEPVDGGTKVTESFDYSVPWGSVLGPLGFPRRIRRDMERTLERLEAQVLARAAGEPTAL